MLTWVRRYVKKARGRVYPINAFQIFCVLIILCFVLAVRGTWAYTGSSGFCATCHPKMVKHWSSSTHGTVACRQCHVEPGMKGAVEDKVHGLHNVYVALTQGVNLTEHETPLPINSDLCLGCHNGILYLNELGYQDLPDNSLKSDGLAVGHRLHVEKHGIDCVWCHRGTVHRDPEIVGKYAFNMPFHEDCRACHDGQHHDLFDLTIFDCEDPNSCFKCHPTAEEV
jgi:hypothetical protein